MKHRLGNESDLGFMRVAIAEAKIATKEGNAPIGAVVVRNGRVVERGHNKVFTSHDVTAHAEIVVIRKLTRKIRSFDLKTYALFTTFVPCAMCTATVLRTIFARSFMERRLKMLRNSQAAYINRSTTTPLHLQNPRLALGVEYCEKSAHVCCVTQIRIEERLVR